MVRPAVVQLFTSGVRNILFALLVGESVYGSALARLGENAGAHSVGAQPMVVVVLLSTGDAAHSMDLPVRAVQ